MTKLHSFIVSFVSEELAETYTALARPLVTEHDVKFVRVMVSWLLDVNCVLSTVPLLPERTRSWKLQLVIVPFEVLILIREIVGKLLDTCSLQTIEMSVRVLLFSAVINATLRDDIGELISNVMLLKVTDELFEIVMKGE